MEKISIVLLTALAHLWSSAQNKLVKDLDNDYIKDTVYVNSESSKIVCRLSSHGFRRMESKVMEILNEQSGVSPTKNGFEFYNNWMRAGYRNQFRYSRKEQRMQLIGMSRYEFGNAMNDGSGESSINLLTSGYIGNWNFYDEGKDTLVSIPAIKARMLIAAVYLESFSDETYFNYAGRCSALFEKYKKLLSTKK